MLEVLELTAEDQTWLRKAAALDALAWREEFGVEHDRTALICESNVFRYRPLLKPLEVRIGVGYKLRDILRLQLAALITGSPVRFSAAEELTGTGISVDVISDAAFAREIHLDQSIR